MPDPLESINKLGKRLAEEAEKIGLHLEHFLVATMQDPPQVQCIFTVDVANLTKDAEQDEWDKQFDQMMREQKDTEQQQVMEAMRAEAAARTMRRRAELQERMENGGNIVPRGPQGEGER